MFSLSTILLDLNTVNASQDPPPDPALLEFLADSVQLEKEVIDPVSYSEIDQMTADEREQQNTSGSKHE